MHFTQVNWIKSMLCWILMLNLFPITLTSVSAEANSFFTVFNVMTKFDSLLIPECLRPEASKKYRAMRTSGLQSAITNTFCFSQSLLPFLSGYHPHPLRINLWIHLVVLWSTLSVIHMSCHQSHVISAAERLKKALIKSIVFSLAAFYFAPLKNIKAGGVQL